MKPALLILSVFLLIQPSVLVAAESSLSKKLAGRILLQVESYGRAWYVNPEDLTRYYLKNGDESFALMKNLGLGITNANLAKIPASLNEPPQDPALVKRLKGRILLQVEEHGQAWYVSPRDGVRYYLKDGQSAYALMQSFGLGIRNRDLARIPMNTSQLVADSLLTSPGYALLKDDVIIKEKNGDTIMPLASLSKLMSALVILDLNPDWTAPVTVENDDIAYPKLYSPDAETSEIDLAEGDVVTIHDLFIALLVSSSNQAAVILSEETGLERQAFVLRMNQKAKELGLTKTVFFEPSGLDPHNVSTPKEMAVIAKKAFDEPRIRETSQITDYLITAKTKTGEPKTIPVKNRNASLLAFKPEASKTGYLLEAQRTVALKKGGLIITVLHARSMNERNSIIKTLLNP